MWCMFRILDENEPKSLPASRFVKLRRPPRCLIWQRLYFNKQIANMGSDGIIFRVLDSCYAKRSVLYTLNRHLLEFHTNSPPD